jgi:peptidoglycan/xylan/chitin deacetylase (PgdA/CDA1 family)
VLSAVAVFSAPAQAIAVARWEPWMVERHLPGMQVKGVVTKSRVVAITIDDIRTRNAADTVAALDKAGLRATLFCIASQTDAESVRLVVASGNELASHSYKHKRLSRLTPDKAQRQIELASMSLWKKGGVWPTWYRPPFQEPGTNRALIAQDGLLLAGESDNPRDYNGSSAKTISRQVIKKLRYGGVIMLHPTPETLKALPMIEKELAKKHFTAVTMTELTRDYGEPTSHSRDLKKVR